MVRISGFIIIFSSDNLNLFASLQTLDYLLFEREFILRPIVVGNIGVQNEIFISDESSLFITPFDGCEPSVQVIIAS